MFPKTSQVKFCGETEDPQFTLAMQAIEVRFTYASARV